MFGSAVHIMMISVYGENRGGGTWKSIESEELISVRKMAYTRGYTPYFVTSTDVRHAHL